jgi:hypothetical protein
MVRRMGEDMRTYLYNHVEEGHMTGGSLASRQVDLGRAIAAIERIGELQLQTHQHAVLGAELGGCSH